MKEGRRRAGQKCFANVETDQCGDPVRANNPYLSPPLATDRDQSQLLAEHGCLKFRLLFGVIILSNIEYILYL